MQTARLVMTAAAMTLAGMLAAGAAAAATSCGPRDSVIVQLADKYAEGPAGVGLATNGGLMELWTAGDGQTWTLFITMPNGQSCLLAAGENWQTLQLAVIAGPGI